MLDFAFSAEDGGSITCNAPQPWDGVHINDQEAARCFERLRQNVPSWRRRLSLQPAAPLLLQELRLPRQGLGDRAVRGMVEAFVKGTVRVTAVELYKNRLGDAGAQALSVLLECCPAPGLKRLHLSHNYFSQVGVGLLLTAAARSGRYPRWEADAEAGAPLWLRVENQLCPWPVLSGVQPNVQLEKAQLLVDHLGKKLVKGMQESGFLGREVAPESFKIFCIPRPPRGYRAELDDDGLPNFGPYEYDQSTPCNSERCCHSSKHGPIVHLPYFWSQNGKMQKVPEVASLHLHDKGWKNWLPTIPIGSRRRAAAFHSIADAPKDGPAAGSAGAAAEGAPGGALLPLEGGDGGARSSSAAASSTAPAAGPGGAARQAAPGDASGSAAAARAAAEGSRARRAAAGGASGSGAAAAALEAKAARGAKPGGGEGPAASSGVPANEAAAPKRRRLRELPAEAASCEAAPAAASTPDSIPAVASPGPALAETLPYPEQAIPSAEAPASATAETLPYPAAELPSFAKPLRLAAAAAAVDLG